MNILYIVPYMPNLIRVRSYNLVRQLAARGNFVTVCTLWTDLSEQSDGAILEKYPGVELIACNQTRWRSLWNCIKALPSSTPLQAVYSWLPKLEGQIVKRLNSNAGLHYDIVHVEHLRGVHYGLAVKKHLKQIPVIWDSVDCISYLFEQAANQSRSVFGRMVTRLDLNRTRRYEGWLAGQFDRVLITSAVDKQALLDLVPSNVEQPHINVVPNGVDWDYFGVGEEVERDPATIVFSGKMSYHANITMLMFLVREVMPLVWAKNRDVKLLVVGKDPTPGVRSLGENPAIKVTGTVPDLRPYLRKATLAVVPLIYGAGSQLKLLEAMACGTPVVATPRAVLALDAKAGQDLLVAEQPEQMAASILQIVDNPEFRYMVGQNGRKYVQHHHRWSGIAKQLENYYHNTIQTSSSSE